MSDAVPARMNNGPNDTSGSAPVGRGRRILRMLALMGPAFIVGAWQFGPGNLTSAVQAGSRFGYSLIWVIAVSTALMLIYADMSIRIALVSKGSVVQTIKEHLGRRVGCLAGFGVFAITLMFSVGNAVGSGLGLSLVFGGSPMWWTLACTAVVVGILFARRLYTLIEKLVLVIVAIMAVSFVATAIVTRPDWGAAAVGSVVPIVPSGVGLLIVALVGTNFSVNAAFYAGYASRERGLRREQYRETTIADTIPGIVAPGIMTALVIMAAAAVLPGVGGEEGATLKQFSTVLTPIAGEAGRTIFSLGFTGAAISAMIANATAGGTLLSDGLGFGNRLASWRVRAGILGVLGFGALITVLARGQSPVQLIIAAQALTVIVAPVLAVLLVVLANRPGLMGDLRNKWWQNALAAIGLVAIAAVCYQLAVTSFS
ncbi:Nramp family divalent metal transporter [Prauserella rugosa]|uniref:NRAMP (Natural resistance-associated macrophage protein)-like metal ion transporter n=1 Tax=Prauserella rugosa TaxID=43354 RepID=A0A660C6Z8_9PSEU|nr:Nramp family divalent metal transporter [Prauserella rugosa]TWH19298.1 NRAMP (natural resistance-associated macrophage protein)-like metal ion transporter [Prauserella rugosa]